MYKKENLGQLEKLNLDHSDHEGKIPCTRVARVAMTIIVASTHYVYIKFIINGKVGSSKIFGLRWAVHQYLIVLITLLLERAVFKMNEFAKQSTLIQVYDKRFIHFQSVLYSKVLHVQI